MCKLIMGFHVPVLSISLYNCIEKTIVLIVMPENSDWETVRRQYHYRCIICRQPEKVTGRMVPVHVADESQNSKRVVPMCPAHHLKYIQGFCTNAELKKAGISQDTYQKSLDTIVGAGEEISSPSMTERAVAAQQDAIKKVEKAQKRRFQQRTSDYVKEI
jgi:hypothetical protein